MMNAENVLKYAGRKVMVTLRDNSKYTFIVPKFNGFEFDVIDKYNRDMTISCDAIIAIAEVD